MTTNNLLYFSASAKVEHILEAIDVWAQDAPFGQVQKLWYVLTALRGPDSGNTQIKQLTTAIIRNKAVPRLTRRIGADIKKGEANLDNIKTVAELTKESTHFLRHAEDAIEALGIAEKIPTAEEIVAALKGVIRDKEGWATSESKETARRLKEALRLLAIAYPTTIQRVLDGTP